MNISLTNQAKIAGIKPFVSKLQHRGLRIHETYSGRGITFLLINHVLMVILGLGTA